MPCGLYPYKRKDFTNIQEIGWHLSSLNVPRVWDFAQGEGVVVAVIDTGVDFDHEDLQGNLLDGYNVLNPKERPIDDNDHGTHITGTICANNNEIGIVGIAPKAKVFPIKALRNGFGQMKDIAKGIRCAVERNVDMICLSIGSARPVASVRKAIKKACNQGIPIFCAGGNVKKDMDVLYPARYPETIAIGALDKDFNRADFSNAAKNNIDFLAPGVDIVSTVRNNWYASLSGSSMAVPFVAGVVSLALSAKRQHQINVKMDDFRVLLKEHAADLSKCSGKEFAGCGVIDPVKMIDWLKSELHESDL